MSFSSFSSAPVEASAIIHYYQQVKSFLFPCLKQRPLSVLYFPLANLQEVALNTIGDSMVLSFTHQLPEALKQYRGDDEGQKLVCNSPKMLDNLIGAGCYGFYVEPFLVASETEAVQWVCFQLTAHPEVRVARIRESALKLVDFLQKQGWPVYIKTAPFYGLDVVVPAKHPQTGQVFSSHQVAMNWANQVANHLGTLYPRQFSQGEISTVVDESSLGQVYLYTDVNAKGRSMSAPYSLVDPLRGLVSQPLSIDDLRQVSPFEDGMTLKPHFNEVLKVIAEPGFKDCWTDFWEPLSAAK